MINLKYFTLAVFILCLISLISFGWSAEKPKVPSGTVVIPASPIQGAPLKAIIPFDIKVDNKTSEYLFSFHLSANLVPKTDSQSAKDAISGKSVSFYVDDKFVVVGTSDSNGHVDILISVSYSRQLNLQVGTHKITAHTTHEGQVIKGYGNLTVKKKQPYIDIQSLIPVSNYYTIGQTITLAAILQTEPQDYYAYPITHVNVNCNYIDSNGNKKFFMTVQTNNQGGFECPLTITQDKIWARGCNVFVGQFIVDFIENQNYTTRSADKLFHVCPQGMHYYQPCSGIPNCSFECCK